MNALIGYYNGDQYGGDGWWEEGSNSEELKANALELALLCGFDSAPKLVEVETLKLSEVPDDKWGDLYIQWRIARRSGWTSGEVDLAIEAEEKRREGGSK